MTYDEFAPMPQLRPWIAAYWRFRVERGAGELDHTVPLTGGAMLLTSPRGPTMLVGPRTEPLTTKVQGGDEFRGIHFWPGAAPALLGPRASGLREKVVPAMTAIQTEWVHDFVCGAWRDADFSSAMDAALSDLADQANPMDDLAMTCVFQLIRNDGRHTLADLAEGVGLSQRQLRRRFVAAVEMTPKELGRLRRMRASAAHAMQHSFRGWVEIAAEYGYADQAHLVREFRRLVGLTPKRFDQDIGRIRHGKILS